MFLFPNFALRTPGYPRRSLRKSDRTCPLHARRREWTGTRPLYWSAPNRSNQVPRHRAPKTTLGLSGDVHLRAASHRCDPPGSASAGLHCSGKFHDTAMPRRPTRLGLGTMGQIFLSFFYIYVTFLAPESTPHLAPRELPSLPSSPSLAAGATRITWPTSRGRPPRVTAVARR